VHRPSERPPNPQQAKHGPTHVFDEGRDLLLVLVLVRVGLDRRFARAVRQFVARSTLLLRLLLLFALGTSAFRCAIAQRVHGSSAATPAPLSARVSAYMSTAACMEQGERPSVRVRP